MVEIPDKEYQKLQARLKELEVAVAECKRAEEALRESEEKYRGVVERANDGIIIIHDGMIKYANRRLAEMYGNAVENIIGNPFEKFIAPEEFPKVVERYQKRMRGESVESMYEMMIQRKDGSRMPTEVNAGMITYLGKPADLIFVRDVTERKRAEAEIKASEEKYRTLIESASDQIFMVNEELKFVSMNGAALNQLRKKLDEVIGKPVSEVFPKEISANNIENLEKVFKTGQNSFIEEELNFGGNRVFVSTSLSPVKNIEGKTVEVLGVVRDFTERKRREEELANKIKELEKMTKIMEGREDRIIELKDEIKRLKGL